MDAAIEREVRADAQRVYQLAARVENWPSILPHYRWVHVLEASSADRRTVAMAARRDVVGRLGIPVRWVAVQTLYPNEPRIEFVHIRGITRGMHVAWTFDGQPSGRLLVRIRHVFEPRWPVPPSLVRLIVGDYFVNGVARRTLRRICELAE